MKIVVCMKQVPATSKVDIDPETGAMKRMSGETRTNPYDLFALETALAIREKTGGTVSVLTMGPPQAEEMIRDAYTMGADEGVILSDRKFAGADVLATSYALAQGIQVIGGADLIICGRQTTDGDTAQVGPQISEHLDIPVISYAQNLKVEGDSVIVERQYDDRYHVLKAKMPCLVTALAELNEPRYMTPGGIFDAYDAEITVWGRKDLKDVEDSNLGLKGSPTQIAKASDKVRKGAGEKVALDPAESVDYIMDKLLTKHVI